MTRRSLVGLLAAFFFTLSASAANTVSDARFSHLRHGINLSHWYAQAGPPSAYTKQHLDEYDTDADFALIHQMGFDHVRLTIDPGPLFDEQDPGHLNQQWLGYLNASVKSIMSHDLAVIIDIHPAGEFNRELNNSDTHVRDFAMFWRALAKNFSTYDPDRLFLELMNEPEVQDTYRWMGIQQTVEAAMREGAPQHTIIVSGPRWSGLPDLLTIMPIPDQNVIYNFHYYEPMMFTHQGATWAGETQRDIQHSPYPSSPEAIQPMLANINSPEERLQFVRFGYDRWNADRIAADFAQVAAWQKKYGVRVTVNEFGVFDKFADPKARAAYLHDVRTAAESDGFGWTMWDYAGGFSVVHREPGKAAVPDELTLAALGLAKASR